ncbi:NAD(P)/FAD-dependent oxidoreductase [Nocardiopsis sp. EMB25]|uniref:NAD(P)/FAD-dependent oxidoreductase n=1 Tax=Nocardiopsis sp. EMB25 TaxID=2835867 RepID=UPI002284E45B|nr:NAD(P)/FAD-dependent oxidoreductase [Nocardiopsis sp. EMB25]MCY9783702.1 NAD(P)/FAD-dependent oxidoreductase [Nocardiopsis sp. EMB25]
MNTEQNVDVAVIGGGAAGLSAAITLARSLRSVIVVDAGEPRNAPAEGAHNVLGLDGVAPRDLLATGRAEAERYGARVHEDRAVAARRRGDVFEVDLAVGATVRARRLLLATGLVDELPAVPGVRELWGGGVLHCAYCHGWEVRGQRIGVLGTSPMSVHQALMFRQLSEDVTLFVHTMPEPDDDAWEQLAALNIQVVDGTVRMLRTDGGVLRTVVLADGHEFAVDAVTVTPRFIARSDLYEQLGGTLTEHPMGAFVATGPKGRTDVPGVWAAGNTSDLAAMVTAAEGAGVEAATAINADLVTEDAAAAVRARAQRYAAV